MARLAFLGVILGGLGKVENTLAAGLIVGLIQTVCMALLPFDYVYLVLYLLLAAILILRREGLSRAARRAPRLAGVLGLSDPAGTQECRRRRSCVGLLVDRSCRPYPVWGGACFLELRFSSPRWSTSSSRWPPTSPLLSGRLRSLPHSHPHEWQPAPNRCWNRACVFYRGLYAQRIAYIEPIGTFAFDISLNVVLMAVIGGPGTWQGPLIGAPLVLLVADALRVTFTSEVNRVIFPGGIMGWLARWRRWRNLAELQGIISLPKMPISVMPNRTLTSPSHIRSSFSRFAQHLSADQQPFAPTIWPDCRLRLRCGRGGYSAEIAKINVLGMPAP